MNVAEYSLWESLHLETSRACWEVELANRFRNAGVFVPGPDSEPAKFLSTLPFGNFLPPTLLHPQNNSRPAPVHTATSVVEVSISACFTTLLPVFKILDLEKTECEDDDLSASYTAQAVRFTDLIYVESLRTIVRGGRWASDFGVFSVMEKNSLSHRL